MREALDTIVTVVVVVLLLRTYVAEAFMIPTGSMATTLYGYQKQVVCPECRFPFPVNCSNEQETQRAEPGRGGPVKVKACTCPNCRLPIALDDTFKCDSGDRVLVAKYYYDWTPPQRLDVVVFKNPDNPQVKYDPLNSIKRLVGLPGETIAIQAGDLYVNSDLKYAALPHRPMNWRRKGRRMVTGSPEPEGVESGKAIIRKPPARLSMRARLRQRLPGGGLATGFHALAGKPTAAEDFRGLRQGRHAGDRSDHAFATRPADSLAWFAIAISCPYETVTSGV